MPNQAPGFISEVPWEANPEGGPATQYTPDPHGIGAKATAMDRAGVQPHPPNSDKEEDLDITQPRSGKFIVMRSDGTVEDDWVKVGSDPQQPGKIILQKQDPNNPGRVLEKAVSPSILQRWQREQTAERREEDHFKKVFAPPVLEVSKPEDPRWADWLLGEVSDEEYAQKNPDFIQAEKEAHEQSKYLAKRTPESVQHATQTIARVLDTDPELLATLETVPELRRAISNHTDLELVSDTILQNPDLRYKIGMHLLKKTQKLGGRLPQRVRANQQKQLWRPVPGITHLPGQEYTALLALSMLDGTFIRSDEEDSDYDSRTDSGGGQHRYAARTVLYTN